MQKTNIGWTDYTANPIKFRDGSGKIVWGCVKVSPGCANCYAEALALRFDRGSVFNAATMAKLTPLVDGEELKKLLLSKAIAGKRVFIEDMSDLFGSWVNNAMLNRVFTTMVVREDVTFQLLTKRAERMRDFLSSALQLCDIEGDDFGVASIDAIPSPNIHLGVSVENQKAAEKRIPHLLAMTAAVRWISAEPLLGPINLKPYVESLDWVVIGGESGKGHRDCDPKWIEDIVRQCDEVGCRVYVKQDSGPRPGMQGRLPLAIWSRKERPSI